MLLLIIHNESYIYDALPLNEMHAMENAHLLETSVYTASYN